MSCKALQLNNCEIFGSTFKGRKFTIINRNEVGDILTAKVKSFDGTILHELTAEKINSDFYFSFSDLELLKVGGYKIEYWLDLLDVAKEMIAIENLRISQEPCNCEPSSLPKFSLDFGETVISLSVELAIVNIGGGGVGGSSVTDFSYNEATEKLSLKQTNNQNFEVLLPKGRDGRDGIDGKDGKDGINGADGYTPVKGVDYFDGANGRDGVDGAQGQKGDKGATGAKGDKGDKGDTGPAGSDVNVTYATQAQSENQTPPSTDANLVMSLYNLWKWDAKRSYVYLQTTTANTVPNKDWSDGTRRYFTDQNGVNQQYLFDGDLVRRIDGTFNPPTQAQLTSLGIKRGDFYQNTNTSQRAMYNGNQLVEWTVTNAEWNALSTDQKNAVKHIFISE